VESTFIFDVNETLLNAAILDDLFREAFGTSRARPEWFAELVQRALICNAVGEYRPFPELAAVALDAIGVRYGMHAVPNRNAVLEAFAHAPAHGDVAPALGYLRDAGARIVALTNSPLASAEEALAAAGIRDFFAQLLSVETVRCFKPHRRVYEMAAAAVHEAPSRLWLISAHWWDCLGAARLGWKTALIRRAGTHNDATMVLPALEGDDLVTLARALAPATERRAL
jgi:2-haloacid dehalogenase